MSDSPPYPPYRLVAFAAAPARIDSAPNSRMSWQAKHRVVRQQRVLARSLVGPAIHAWAPSRDEWQVVVILRRIGPRGLDGDNLQGGLKAVRDGVADALRLDDGNGRIEWRYEQRRALEGEADTLNGFGLEIEIREVLEVVP